MWSHYVSSYCDHYHSSCDCCVLWSITHQYDGYNSLLPLWARQHWVSIMWVCHHSLFQGTQWIMLASPLCHSNDNLSPSSQAKTTYPMDPPQLSLSFKVEPSNDFLYHVLVSVLVFCFLLPFFRFPCCCHVHKWRAQPFMFATPEPFRFYPW